MPWEELFEGAGIVNNVSELPIVEFKELLTRYVVRKRMLQKFANLRIKSAVDDLVRNLDMDDNGTIDEDEWLYAVGGDEVQSSIAFASDFL